MRIGLDAKWYFDGPASGKVVVRHLVDEIARLDREDEIFVFLDRRFRGQPFPVQRPNVHPVYVWSDNNLLSNLIVLPRYERRLSIDVTVVQNFASIFMGSRRIAFVHDALFLTHPQFYSWIERLYFAPMRFLARHAEGICTVSESERGRLIEAGFTKSNREICVVYHGVDAAFRPRSSRSRKERDEITSKFNLPGRFLLYVGRLNVRKNIGNLLRALALMAHEEVPLVVVGHKDWKSSDDARLARILGVGDRVIFTGPMYGEELAITYSLAEVVCFPSYAESFGLPALEGMASGVPVVVSNTTSLPEVCAEAGNYVSPNDPASIARMIDQLLDDPRLYSEKQKAGLARAALFTWSGSATCLLQFIRTVYSRASDHENRREIPREDYSAVEERSRL